MSTITDETRETVFEKHDDSCYVCGITQSECLEEDQNGLHLHHIDGNEDNSVADNLIPVCRTCHFDIHYGRVEELHEKLPPEKQWNTEGEWVSIAVPLRVEDKLKAYSQDNEKRWEVLERILDAFPNYEKISNSSDSAGVDMDELEDRLVARLARETQADLQNMRDEIIGSVSAECGDVATTEDIGDLADLIRDIDGGSSSVELDASERNKIAREVAEVLQ